VIQAINLNMKTLNEEPDIRDLPIAPLFGSFTSPCKEPAKQKDEHQNYFILEKNIYNSFTGASNKVMVPCIYMTSNGRYSTVAESTKSSAVFSVAGELFIGTNLAQIVCTEIEWLYPTARKENINVNTRGSPKRENMLQFEQQIINKRSKKGPTLPTR
jgi:hypothetical protein